MIRICFSCFRCNDDAIQGAVLLADGPFPDASHDPWLGLLNFLFPGPLLHYRATRRLGPVQLERYFAVLLQNKFEECKVERGESGPLTAACGLPESMDTTESETNV